MEENETKDQGMRDASEERLEDEQIMGPGDRDRNTDDILGSADTGAADSDLSMGEGDRARNTAELQDRS